MPNAISVPSIRDIRMVGILTLGGLAGGGSTVPFTSVNANGWSVTYPSPPTFAPDVTPLIFPVTRQGWDENNAATTWVENLVFTERIRQVAPNHASLTLDQVALSNYIYSTDLVSGATNNSLQTSPPPVANWTLVDRRLVGNTLTLEVTCWHRNYRDGRQVPCVPFTVTDSAATSITQKSTLPTVSSNPGDQHKVITWHIDFDVSSLANGQLTANADIPAWIGGPTSRNNSATNGTTAGTREFCPQIFWKDPALLAARPRVYMDAAGSDTLGVASTNDALAAASPVQSLNGAINKARATFGVGACDGLIIFGRAGTWELTASITAGNLATNHEIILTRDPAVSKAACIFGFGTGNYNNRIPFFRIQDTSAKRNGTLYISSGATGFNFTKVIFSNVDFDNSSFNAVLSSSTTAGFYFDGNVVITNGGASLLAAGNPEIRLVRGVTYGSAVASWAVEGWLVLGCEFTNVAFTRGARGQSGSIIAFNRNMKVTSLPVFPTSGASATGFAICQNVIEYVSVTGNPTLRLSGDSELGDLTHAIILNNTYVGADLAGRANIFYDDGPLGNLRSHTLTVSQGNIHVQLNYKSDIFALTNAGLADASSRIGTWSYGYGVGCSGEFSMYVDASGGSDAFRQMYHGLGARIGASPTVRQDPLFTNYQGTQKVGAVYSAGAGGGDYTLLPGSPCKGIVPYAALPFDLAGNPRPTMNDSAGAYV